MRDVRQQVGDGDADLRAGGMQIVLRRRVTSGRCSTSFAGRLTGSSAGKLQRVESRRLGRLLAGQAPEAAPSAGRAAARAASAAAAVLVCLRQRRLLRRHVRLGDLAQLVLALHRSRRARFPRDDLWVAAIWPRRDASCTAAATTLAVSVR